MHRCNIRNNGAFAFYVSSNDSLAVIDATDSWWGVADSLLIENIVYHHADRDLSPLVSFVPFANTPFVIDPGTAVEDDFGNPGGDMPTEFALYQNHPNPFNSGTMIEFFLPRKAEITIAVYDILGRLARELGQRQYQAGTNFILFDGRDNYGNALPSGIYLYRFRADNFLETKKMLLLK